MKSRKINNEAAAIYIRISTDEDLQKWSLGGQEKELRNLAKRRGWNIYKVYKDTISGVKSSRPGLNELRDDMAEGKFSVILVVDQDRLSRMEPVDWELFKSEIRDAGIKMITPASEVDFSDEDSELVSDVFNLFARHQRRKIKKAMRRGRMEAVERGNWLGKAPYGRVKKRGTLELDPVAGPIVLKIFELYGLENMGSLKIANYLNSLKILSPGGSKWEETTVIRVLSNSVHRGEIISFVNGKKVKVTNAFEPTVPVELFDSCQRILHIRSTEYHWQHNQKVTSLGAEVIVCGKCGRSLNVLPIYTRYKDKVYAYYYYRHRKRCRGKNLKDDCKVSFSVEQIDQQILEFLQVICSGPTAFGKLINFETSEIQKKLKEKLNNLRKSDKILRQKIKKLISLYLDSDWDKAFLSEQKDYFTNQLRQNELEQQRVKKELFYQKQQTMNVNLAAEYLALLKNIEKELDKAELRKIIKAVFWRIELTDEKKLHFICSLPLDKELFYSPS